MYGTPYYNNFNQQANIDRINNQIAELERIKSQMPMNTGQHQPSINQTFQLAPNNNSSMKYVGSIDEVNKEFVIGDTPFFSKDLSVMWLKNTKGEVKAYELKEIIQKDEKDLMIESLQMQIDEMKGMLKNAKSSDDDTDEPIESKKSTNVSNARTSKAKSK